MFSRRMLGLLAVGVLAATPQVAWSQGRPVPAQVLEQLQRARSGEVAKQREADTKLIEELAGKDFAALSVEDYAAGAEAYFRNKQFEQAIKFAQAALASVPNNEALRRVVVQSYLRLEKPAEAEAALTAARAALPESEAMAHLLPQVARAWTHAGEHAKAIALMRTYVDALRPEPLTEASRNYLGAIGQLVAALARDGQHAEALAVLDRELAALPPEAIFNRMDLTAKKARAMHAAGDLSSPLPLVEQALAELRPKLDADPDNELLAQAMIPLLQAAADLSPPDSRTARQALLEFLLAQFQRHPTSTMWLQACANAYQREVQALGQAGQFEETAALVAAFTQVLDGVQSDDESLQTTVARARQGIASQVARLEAESLRQKLIGQPMPPLDVEAWVGGTPLAPADLQGKVVVLDFWAVWCGPCIATFPHLREWQEKYADRGMVMVGLTRHYGYGWDAQAGRAVKSEEVTPEQELAALEEFAAHHQLAHRLAVMPKESTLSKQYGVTGIPQIVVIDQQGVVRLIRVGSGEANAHDVEALLEELFGAPQAQ